VFAARAALRESINLKLRQKVPMRERIFRLRLAIHKRHSLVAPCVAPNYRERTGIIGNIEEKAQQAQHVNGQLQRQEIQII